MSGVPELVLLRALKDRDMYGYEIVQAIRAQTRDIISLREGVIYPLLHALEKDGALRARKETVDGRPRVYYTLTSKGVRRLFDLTDSWTRLQAAIGAVLHGTSLSGAAHAV